MSKYRGNNNIKNEFVDIVYKSENTQAVAG